jgi:hypothetical protein
MVTPTNPLPQEKKSINRDKLLAELYNIARGLLYSVDVWYDSCSHCKDTELHSDEVVNFYSVVGDLTNMT